MPIGPAKSQSSGGSGGNGTVIITTSVPPAFNMAAMSFTYTFSGHVFGFAENSWKFMVIKVSILDLKLAPSSAIQVSILFLKVSNLS